MASLREVPSDLDIPLQVQVPQLPAPSLAGGNASFKHTANDDSVRAILKYRNDEGRKAILDVANTVHHDFGPFNQTLAVSLPSSNLDEIKLNRNVEWYEGDGRVIYCSIR
mmetsp:Transcript_17403/g.31477  ORF Transcript_17403/g.31477 Transcript_17403/m.31477 type:complete len:110 (+) Transcript_17403:112-441(+)